MRIPSKKFSEAPSQKDSCQGREQNTQKEKNGRSLGVKGRRSVTFKNMTLLLIVLVASIMLRVQWYHITVHTDEAEYGYTAMMWSRHGYPPYLYREDMQPPMVYFFYFLAGSLDNVRILNDTAFLVSVIVMFYLAKELLGGLLEGFVGSFMYAVFMNMPVLEGMYALPASMAIPFIVVSFYFGLAYARAKRESFLVLAGVSVSVAGLLYAREFSFIFILMFMMLEGTLRERRWNEIIRNTAFLLTGALLPSLPFAFYYAGFGRMDVLVSSILSPLSNPSVLKIDPNPMPWVLLFVIEILPLIVLSVIGITISITRKLRRGTLLMMMLALACIIDIFISKFFGHYWLNAMVPSVLLATVTISALLGSNSRTTKRNTPNPVTQARALAIGLLILVSLISFYFQMQQYPTGSIRWGSIEMLYSPFGSYENQTRLATFLRDNTNSSDQILVHGWMPEIYYLSGIEAPSPNLNTIYVGSTIPKTEYQRLLNMVVEQEFKYIVLAHWAGWDIDSIATITRAYYNKIDNIGYVELYERQRLFPVLGNPSFEDATNWVIENSTCATYSTTYAHSGYRSVSIIQSSNVQFYAVWQDIPVKGDTEYVLSAWGLDVPRNGIWLTVGETDSSGNLLQPFRNVFTDFSTSEWSPTAYRLTTLNATTRILVCINILNLGSDYTTYFDDVQLFSTRS